ncbi:MAG: RHS repeat-associated core domain-containing protein [Bacteroidota bacterium]|nr:RHS repeat-associated core domain-containing protein [Bacteroidota bacterium]
MGLDRKRALEYKQSEHIGNVLSTVTNRKLPIDLSANQQVDYFNADIAGANDYYPFGMLQVNRSYSLAEYRFGFNGKEYDSEWNGNPGAMYNYGFRIYDPRIARFPSPDPLIVKEQEYPELSPYQYASLSPIWGIDLDGLELKKVTHHIDQHTDKSLFVKSSDVTINPDITFENKKTGKEYAKTEVYIEVRGTTFPVPSSEFYEPTQEESGGLKPSAAYDYTKEAILGKEKEDWEYIRSGEKGVAITRFFEVFFRDLRALENQVDEDIIEVLDVITTQ